MARTPSTGHIHFLEGKADSVTWIRDQHHGPRDPLSLCSSHSPSHWVPVVNQGVHCPSRTFHLLCPCKKRKTTLNQLQTFLTGGDWGVPTGDRNAFKVLNSFNIFCYS